MFQRFNDTTDIAVLILSYCKILKNVQTQKGLLSTLALRKVTLDFINSNLKKRVRWLNSLSFGKKFESNGKLIFSFFQVKRAKERAKARAKAQERIRRWCYQANDATTYLWLVEHDLPLTHPRHTYSKNVFFASTNWHQREQKPNLTYYLTRSM